MSSRISLKPRAVVGLAAVALVAGASGALAESTHKTTATTLSACVKARGGTMYMAKRCDKGDRRVTWSITGPRGLTGPRGIQGKAGTSAPADITTVTAPTTVTSPTTTPAPTSTPTITGSCENDSAIASISASGTTTCNNVQYYTGRLVLTQDGASGGQVILNVPGIAQLKDVSCSHSGTYAELVPPPPATVATTDIWAGGDNSEATDSFYGQKWQVLDTQTLVAGSGAQSSGTTWHIGSATDNDDGEATITESQALYDGTCVFQASAQVISTS